MSMAMKYAMKKRMAKTCPDCASGKCMAHGGAVGDRYVEGVHTADRHKGDYDQGDGTSVAGVFTRAVKRRDSDIPKETLTKWAKEEHGRVRQELSQMKKPHLYAEGGEVENDIVSRAMKKRFPDEMADMESDDFDQMDLEPAPEADYPGSEEIGDEAEDQDRRDIVSRVMKSRAKKDRNPRPA